MNRKPQSLKVEFIKVAFSCQGSEWAGAGTTESCVAPGNRFASDRGGLEFGLSSDETEGCDPANSLKVRKKIDDLLCST